MEKKTLVCHKNSFGGTIIFRIEELLNDKTKNGFEIITLTKGLTNNLNITMLHLMYIHVVHNGDLIELHYVTRDN